MLQTRKTSFGFIDHLLAGVAKPAAGAKALNRLKKSSPGKALKKVKRIDFGNFGFELDSSLPVRPRSERV